MTFELFFLMCLVVVSEGININSLRLEQVLILSRHNVRTPLTSGLEMYSTKQWPKWNNSAGVLTKKGAELEGYMGKYIAEWLDTEELIEGCPNEDEVIVYANTKQRTIATAKAFVESAFQSCNITVQHDENLEVFDPVFFPILHNTSEAFKNQVRAEMQSKLNALDLRNEYIELDRILVFETADICTKLFLCDFLMRQSEVVLEDGEEPNVRGPLFIANSIVDSFVMSYYEGMPIENVAWGEIASDKQWKLLAKIIRANQDVRFNLTTASKDLAGPLLSYMFNIFENGTPKLTVLFGHDSNLNSVINALGFKRFTLPKQFEPYPIGGKVVFQKWTDNANTYLKVEYVYPSTKQLRYGEKLSMHKPPQKVFLELKDCKISPNGYCLWDDFMKLNVY